MPGAARLTSSAEILEGFAVAEIDAVGSFALEQGFILSAMILSAATVMVIERRFLAASAWTLAGAILSAIGFLHAWRWTVADTVIDIGFSNGNLPWVAGHLAMAAVFAGARWLTQPAEARDIRDRPSEDA